MVKKLFAFAIVGAIVAKCMIYFIQLVKDDELIVDTLYWPQNDSEIEHFLAEIVSNRVPVVIKNHPLFNDINDLSNKWSIDNLLSYYQNKLLFPKTNNIAPIFEYFEPDLPLTDILDWHAPNNDSNVGKTLKQHLIDLRKQTKLCLSNDFDFFLNNDFEFKTLSFEINEKDDSKLLQNIALYDLFLNDILKIKSASFGNLQLQTLKFWIGFYGVITKLHFDAAHNFNFQIQGCKEFELISPKYHFDKQISLFPWLHPQSRKSQMDNKYIYEKKDENLPFSHLIGKITLKEKEILYIPPMFMHRVFVPNSCNNYNYKNKNENENDSPKAVINFNIWLQGIESNFQSKLFGYPIPFDLYDNDLNDVNNSIVIKKQFLLFIALKHWFQALIDESNVRNKDYFIQNLIESRYEPLYADRKNFKQTFELEKANAESELICNEILSYEKKFNFNKQNAILNQSPMFIGWYETNIMDKKDKYAAYARNISNFLVDSVSQPVSEIMLVAYFEVVAEYFLNVGHVYPFLKFCF